MDPDDQDMPAIVSWYDNTSNSLFMQDMQVGDNLPSLTITPVKTEIKTEPIPAIVSWYDNTSNSLLMQDVQMGDNLPSLTITPVKTEFKTEPISNMEYTELMDINPGDFKLDYDQTSGDFIDQLYADVCLLSEVKNTETQVSQGTANIKTELMTDTVLSELTKQRPELPKLIIKTEDFVDFPLNTPDIEKSDFAWPTIKDVETDNEEIFMSDESTTPTPPQDYGSQMKTDVENTSNNMRVCTEDSTCSLPSHVKMGIFTPEHKHANKDYLHLVLQVLTMLQCTVGEVDKTADCRCMLCYEGGMTFQQAKLHMRTEHGHAFGNYNNIEGTSGRLQEIRKWRIAQAMTYPLLQVCGICYLVLGTGLDLLIHSCVHTHLDQVLRHCPFIECLTPLYNVCLPDHFYYCHQNDCCTERIANLAKYLNHLFDSHCHRALASLSYRTVKTLYQLSSTEAPRLFWVPETRILLLPNYPNPNLPDTYSASMGALLDKIEDVYNPYLTFLRPSNYAEDYADYVKTRWVPDTDLSLLWKDLEVQKQINIFMYQLWVQLEFNVSDIFRIEARPHVHETAIPVCRTCQDTVSHHASPELCTQKAKMGPVFSSRNINKLLTMQIGEYAAIWVGFADLCYGLLPTSKYKLLNMSSYCSKSFNYATHYNHGTQVKLQDSGKFTIHFNSWFRHLKDIVAFMPKNFHIPIFLEFWESRFCYTKTEMIDMCSAFVSQVDTMRTNYKMSFIILGPIAKFTENMTQEQYILEKLRVRTLSNILALLCTKANIIIIPMLGIVSSAKSSEDSFWSKNPNNYDEKIFNINGTPTRELLRRVGVLVDKVLDEYGIAVRSSLFLPTYLRNILHGAKAYHFKYPKQHV